MTKTQKDDNENAKYDIKRKSTMTKSQSYDAKNVKL